MNNQEILEYNKRCAKFYGGKRKNETLIGIGNRMSEDEWWLPIFGIKRDTELRFDRD